MWITTHVSRTCFRHQNDPSLLARALCLLNKLVVVLALESKGLFYAAQGAVQLIDFVNEPYSGYNTRGLFCVEFVELTGARKRDLCPGSKRSVLSVRHSNPATGHLA